MSPFLFLVVNFLLFTLNFLLPAHSGRHHFFALGALGGNELAALFVAGLLEMLILAQLLCQAFFFAGLLETAQNFFQTFTGSCFYSDHKYPQ